MFCLEEAHYIATKRRVIEAEARIILQRALISNLKRRGRAAESGESLLRTMEEVLSMLQAHEEILRRSLIQRGYL